MWWTLFVVMCAGALSFVLPAPGRPRIVPVPLETAQAQIMQWEIDNKGKGLQAARRLYHVQNTPNIGTLALMFGYEIHALVLMERVRGTVCIWSIDCVDSQSGTLMVSALCKAPQRMELKYTVHPRWHIAKGFFDTA